MMIIDDNSTGIIIEGYERTFRVVDSKYISKYGFDEVMFLLEDEIEEDEAEGLIVNNDGDIIVNDVWNGWEDMDDTFNPFGENLL